MSTFIALLRAVNVGGTGKLPMAELKAMCEEIGFSEVRTYIASGNVIFKTSLTALKTQKALEERLHAYAGKPVGVLIRTPQDMAKVLANNPFSDCAPNRTVAIFLDETPATDAITLAKNLKSEQIVLGEKEIYVHYGDGMANSKLILPSAKKGTARNMNTIAKLITLAS